MASEGSREAALSLQVPVLCPSITHSARALPLPAAPGWQHIPRPGAQGQPCSPESSSAPSAQRQGQRGTFPKCFHPSARTNTAGHSLDLTCFSSRGSQSWECPCEDEMEGKKVVPVQQEGGERLLATARKRQELTGVRQELLAPTAT